MTEQLEVRHLEGDRFAIDVRGHTVFVDQPVSSGGSDTAPTPTELFVAGLASCVAFYGRRYLARHQMDDAGLIVSARYDMGGQPNRVCRIDILVTPPPALPVERRDAFLAVASHCTVHNTLTEPANVEITLSTPARSQTPA